MRGSRGGRRGRGRGRGRGGRGRGRTKKSSKVIESDEEEMPMQSGEEALEENDENQQPAGKGGNEWPEQQQQLDMEADISLLEAPTFTTLNRGPPEPMIRLNWDHRVNLIGEKVLNPMIHCCDQCKKPILIYGRMIPCKHVFCLKCAKQKENICPRCNDKVLRVEQVGLGTVFMCVHGGTRYGVIGCRRTYLSQRDLLAHINHRHTVQSSDSSSSQFNTHMKDAIATPSPIGKMLPVPTPSQHPVHHPVSHTSSHPMPHPVTLPQPRVKNDPRGQDINHHRSRGGPSPPPPPPPPYAPMQHRPPIIVTPGYPPSAPPQSSMRTNLITVPIQDVEMPTTTYHHHYSQPPPSQYTHTAYTVPHQPHQPAPQYYPQVTYTTGVQQQYVPQVVAHTQGVPQVSVSQVPQVPQIPQGVPPGVPQNMSVRPPQYHDNQYRPPPQVSHGQQWQLPTNNPPPTFYR